MENHVAAVDRLKPWRGEELSEKEHEDTSKGLRDKDHVDASEVIPELDEWATALLGVRLPREHPWRPTIECHRGAFTDVDAVEMYDTLTTAGINVWVDGGWGIDALLGEQSRPHADLDLALPTRQWAEAHDVLRACGSTWFVMTVRTTWCSSTGAGASWTSTPSTTHDGHR